MYSSHFALSVQPRVFWHGNKNYIILELKENLLQYKSWKFIWIVRNFRYAGELIVFIDVYEVH